VGVNGNSIRVFDDFFSPDYDPSSSDNVVISSSSNNDLLIPKIHPRHPHHPSYQSDQLPSETILTDREDPMSSEPSNNEDNNLQDQEYAEGNQVKQVPSLFAPHDGLPGFPAPNGFVIPQEGFASNQPNVELTADAAGFVMDGGGQSNNQANSGTSSAQQTQEQSDPLHRNQAVTQIQQFQVVQIQAEPQSQQNSIVVEEGNDNADQEISEPEVAQKTPQMFQLPQEPQYYRPQQQPPTQPHPQQSVLQQPSGNQQHQQNNLKSNFPRIEYTEVAPGVSAIGTSSTVNIVGHHARQPLQSNQQQSHINNNGQGIPLHLLIQPHSQQNVNNNNLAFGGRLSGQKHNQQQQHHLPNPSSTSGMIQPRHPVFIDRHNHPIPQKHHPQQQPSSKVMKQPTNQYHRNNGPQVVAQQMQSSASEAISAGQSLQPQTVIIPIASSSASSPPVVNSNIPLGMPVPGLLMKMAKQEQQLTQQVQQQQQNQHQPQMSLAHHLATQMLKAALEDRNMQVSKRRLRRSLARINEKNDIAVKNKVSDHEAQESQGFPGYPFEDGVPPPLFNGPSLGSYSSPHHLSHHQNHPFHENNPNDFTAGSRRRSHTESGFSTRVRGARRSSGINESGSHPKKSFGILGSGNFEVIRGGIYKDEGDSGYAGDSSNRVRGYRHPSHEGDYDDTASNKKQYSSLGSPMDNGSPYPRDEDYLPGLMGFQGFDNFQLASNQEEEMKKMSDDTESESLHPHQSMAASRQFPVVVDSDQDLLATS
jgi:hypothetical protein